MVVGGIFFLIGAVRAGLHGQIGMLNAAFALMGLALMTAAMIAPDLLLPLNRAWAALGLLLHRLISPVALFVMYVGAIVPTGLIMRAFGADPMDRRLDRSADYWRKRTTPRSTARSLKQPF